MTLQTGPRLPDPDEVYAQLLSLYEIGDTETALRAASRLVLLLANHIGDPEVVRMAIEEARRSAVRRPG